MYKRQTYDIYQREKYMKLCDALQRETERQTDRQTERQTETERDREGGHFTRYKSDTVLNILYIPHTLRESNYILLGTDSIQSCTHRTPHRQRDGIPYNPAHTTYHTGRERAFHTILHTPHTSQAERGPLSGRKFDTILCIPHTC